VLYFSFSASNGHHRGGAIRTEDGSAFLLIGTPADALSIRSQGGYTLSEKIAVVTDSTCDIPDAMVEEYNVHVVPLRILYQNEEYLDKVEISPEDVYTRLKDEVPTTSLPRPQDVSELLERLKTEGFTHVLIIHLSAGLSGTGQMLRNMAEEMQGVEVKVMDSKSISMGLGIQVLEAAKAVRDGLPFAKVCQAAETARDNSTVHFVLATLEYLKRGGRIGKVAGTLGQMLNVKPIIFVNREGIYETAAKVRGRRQSIDRLIQVAKERLESPGVVAVCHGAAEREMEEIVEALQGLNNVRELMVAHVSPVIGVHTGPGTIGIMVHTTE